MLVFLCWIVELLPGWLVALCSRALQYQSSWLSSESGRAHFIVAGMSLCIFKFNWPVGAKRKKKNHPKACHERTLFGFSLKNFIVLFPLWIKCYRRSEIMNSFARGGGGGGSLLTVCCMLWSCISTWKPTALNSHRFVITQTYVGFYSVLLWGGGGGGGGEWFLFWNDSFWLNLSKIFPNIFRQRVMFV